MKLRSWLRPLLALGLLGVALFVLHSRLHDLDAAQVLRALGQLPREHLFVAVVLTAVNYLQLTLYDSIALAYLKRSLRPRRVLLTSLVATAFGHNIGPSIASGGTVRYRYYSELGLTNREIATLISFLAITFFVGFCWVGGIVLLSTSAETKFGAFLSTGLLRATGGVLLAIGILYFLLCCLKRQITVRGKSLEVPTPRLAILQVVVAGSDWFVMAGVLSLFMPPGALRYAEVLHTLVVAQVAGMLSQVPGGMGIFESLMLAALGPHVPEASLVGALVGYRVLYFFVPLALAILVLIVTEIRRRTSSDARASMPGVAPSQRPSHASVPPLSNP